MRVDWYGQSAFRLSGEEGTVFIDPFGDASGMAAHGITFEYPAPEGVDADLLLVTHEHFDHNGVESIDGDPVILRSTAGRLESPIGEVVAIASEHDEAAGTERGPNTIFVFTLGGVRIAHFGDFGQTSLRDEQAAAIGDVDLVFLPVGDGPTIGAEQAAAIAERLSPRWIVPMHYRTHRISFLEPHDAFTERMPHVHQLDEVGFDTDELPGDDQPLVIVPAVP
jgi:L-ascorbate metabolism protein UlaG (beta-lactamase superfamily)